MVTESGLCVWPQRVCAGVTGDSDGRGRLAPVHGPSVSVLEVFFDACLVFDLPSRFVHSNFLSPNLLLLSLYE